MSTVNNSEEVKKQYADSGNLSTRISIHDKYSVNRQGFGNWIFSNYRIEPGMKVLELGCGTGSMWKGQGELIAKCGMLVLSDFSEGMVGTAKENVGTPGNIEYKVIDIQNIPYEDGTFDAVIANMMLYHVPDLKKGLSEVRRVLKKDGTFYCATYGEHGIVEYLAALLGRYGVEDKINKVFTLQNGAEILGEFFDKVEKREYIDSLAVTDVDDMVEYIYSLSSMTTLSEVPKAEIRDILIKHMNDGVLTVPKEYGMFLASGEKQ
ncbi:MAG: class I SAM-dependent methyltransferase [Lachnospiraceae bacterium]|nr:class I SAM-dependent methyltransferase [Lachnospiraceae bacterium]